MSFEKVFQYALRYYVNLEHKAVELNLLNKDRISFDYDTTKKSFKKRDDEECEQSSTATQTKKLDSSLQTRLFYTQDPKGLSFALNNSLYKKPDYANKEGYTEVRILPKLLEATRVESDFFLASLPNLYSPIQGVIEQLDIDCEGCNRFVNTLIIKDTLGYRHLFKYFYANMYPNEKAKSSDKKCLILTKEELPISEGTQIQIGDFLGSLAYKNDDIEIIGFLKELIAHIQLGPMDNFSFKYILQDSNGNFLNPITFWQWKWWEHYVVYNAQNKQKESEIIYYFDSNHQIIEIAYKKEGKEYFERFFPHLYFHRFFRDSAYIHYYNHLTQALYPYKLLFNGELEKITHTDYPLFTDKPYGIISLNVEPSEGEILLDCCFTLRNEVLKETLVYFYNTEDKKIYQMPLTNDKGEVQCSIKKEQIHSNTLLYFALNPDEFFDTHFGVCRSHQIMPKEKEQNKTTIHLDLRESNKEQKHLFKLKESATNTTFKQWELDRERKLNSQRIISVINRGDKEIFRLKDIHNLNLIEPNRIVAFKLSCINEIQWFSKKAVNYYEFVSTSNLNHKEECEQVFKIHYETWEEFGEFIERIRPTQNDTKNAASFANYATRYQSGAKGDWKKAKTEGYFLTSMSGMPFWSDALGQLPFAINIYRGFLMLLQNTQPSLDESTRKEMARNATINIGYAFSDGASKSALMLYEKGFIDERIAAIIAGKIVGEKVKEKVSGLTEKILDKEFNLSSLNNKLDDLNLDFLPPLYQKEQYPPLDYLSYDNLMILRGISWVDLYNTKEHYDKLSLELESNIGI